MLLKLRKLGPVAFQLCAVSGLISGQGVLCVTYSLLCGGDGILQAVDLLLRRGDTVCFVIIDHRCECGRFRLDGAADRCNRRVAGCVGARICICKNSGCGAHHHDIRFPIISNAFHSIVQRIVRVDREAAVEVAESVAAGSGRRNRCGWREVGGRQRRAVNDGVKHVRCDRRAVIHRGLRWMIFLHGGLERIEGRF